jgi:hypothetical protein
MVRRALTEPLSMTYSADGYWDITFTHLGKTAEARNLLTNEILQMPHDFSRLKGLLPLHMWPEFARPQLNSNTIPAVSTKQERLF